MLTVEAAKGGVHQLIWNIDSALTADSLLICKRAGAGARGKRLQPPCTWTFIMHTHCLQDLFNGLHSYFENTLTVDQWTERHREDQQPNYTTRWEAYPGWRKTCGP